MVHEILVWPDARLREKTSEVSKFDGALRSFIDEMFETMYAANGVGLAANQIGDSRRLAVIDTSSKQETTKPLVLVNPTIIKSEGELIWEESCLSVPGEAEEVRRAQKVTVQAFDSHGKKFELTTDGLLAIALQHEIDHLDGLVFVDHISSLKRELIKRRMKRLKAERQKKSKKNDQKD